MGRAIKVDNEIDDLKRRIEKLENIVRGMSHTMSERKHIDLIEETKEEEINDKTEKTNNETNDTSSKQSNKRTKKSTK